MNNGGFIKMNKSDLLRKLIKERNTAFVLLAVIADRAKRTEDKTLNDLKINQAYIGDYENYGVSQQIYRDDKKFLEKHGFATFHGTNRGTIATLCDYNIFDINSTSISTNKRPIRERTENEQRTTNKNDKNEKNIYIQDFELEEIASKLQVSLKDTKDTYRQMLDWVQAKGKTYKDYKAGLRTWLHKRLEDGKIKHIISAASVDDPLLQAALRKADK